MESLDEVLAEKSRVDGLEESKLIKGLFVRRLPFGEECDLTDAFADSKRDTKSLNALQIDTYARKANGTKVFATIEDIMTDDTDRVAKILRAVNAAVRDRDADLGNELGETGDS